MEPKDSSHSRVVLRPSESRSQHVAALKQQEAELAELALKLLSEPAHVLVGAELESAAILPSGMHAAEFPLTQERRQDLFKRSPYIAKVVREPVFRERTDLTYDDLEGVQIEFVTGTHAQLPGNMKRRIRPSDLATILEILPGLTNQEAAAYGLERLDFASVPFRGQWDQTSGLQMNINLESKSGKNLFEHNGKASNLMLCFIHELVESDKDATALFCPTPGSFSRLHTFTAPQDIGLGDRRVMSGTSSMLIRGPGYNTRSNTDGDKIYPDPDIENKIEYGGIRLEHRPAGPELLTLAPDVLPYVWMSYYLEHMKLALHRDKHMRKDGSTFTEEELKTIRYPFPKTFKDALEQFRTSPRLQEVMGNNHKLVMEVLTRQSLKSAPVMR